MVAREEGGWGAGERGEGTEKYRLVVTGSHGDVQCSVGNIVNNTGRLYMVPGGTGNIGGEHFIKYVII